MPHGRYDLLGWLSAVKPLEWVEYVLTVASGGGWEAHANHTKGFPGGLVGAFSGVHDGVFVHRRLCIWGQPVGYETQPGWPDEFIV